MPSSDWPTPSVRTRIGGPPTKPRARRRTVNNSPETSIPQRLCGSPRPQPPRSTSAEAGPLRSCCSALTTSRQARQVPPSESLARDVVPATALGVAQISAPVLDQGGGVAASIMLLGPNHELTGAQVAAIGDRVAQAASRAAADVGGGTS